MEEKELLKLQNGSDIRGVACEGVEGEKVNLTPLSSNIISQSFASWLSKKTGKAVNELKIGIGRDSRITGDSLANAAKAGLLSMGVDVTDCGMATTPAMFMSIVFEETSFDGSIMITASHLPFNRNGLKFFDKDGGLEHEDITAILEGAAGLTEKASEKQAETFDLISLYAEHLVKTIKSGIKNSSEKPLAGLKIVVDAGNGAGGFFVSKILKELGRIQKAVSSWNRTECFQTTFLTRKMQKQWKQSSQLFLKTKPIWA